jgi:tetratricopeptide (TPR) repeat protein
MLIRHSIPGIRRVAFGFLFLLVVFMIATACASGQESVRGNQAIKLVDESGQIREVKLYEGSYALVIGVSDYTNGWRKLPGVEEDLSAIDATLERRGFDVETLRDPSRDYFRYRLEQFINLHGLKPGNRLLIYFAGHGHTAKINGQEIGYLVMKDAPSPGKDFDLFQQRAIEMSEIESLARRIKAKHVLFVFDSCFSGSLMRNRGQKPSEFISYITARPVRQFITSGTANQTVPDKSIFRVMFERGLKGDADVNGDGYVTGSELGLYLQQRVADYTNNAQTPQYSKIRDIELDEGDFVFTVAEVQPAANLPISVNECDRVKDSYSRGKELLDDHKPDLALLEYDKGIRLNVKCAELFIGRAAVYLTKQDYSQAFSALDQAVKNEPENPKPYSFRGLLHSWRGEHKEAIDDLSKAIEMCHGRKGCTDYLDFFTRAKSYNALKEIDKAIEDFTKAIELRPLEAEAYRRRGKLYMMEKQDLNLALADLDRAVSLDPTDAAGFQLRGATLIAKGKLEKNNELVVKGIIDMGKAIEIEPENIDLLEVRAAAYEMLGEGEKAKADQKKAEEIKKKKRK